VRNSTSASAVSCGIKVQEEIANLRTTKNIVPCGSNGGGNMPAFTGASRSVMNIHTSS